MIQSLDGLAWWAVTLFVWIAGVELDLKQAWRHRHESGITAALALGLPLLFMIIFANVLLDKQIITCEAFTALLLMAVASTALTIPIVTPMLARLRSLVRPSH